MDDLAPEKTKVLKVNHRQPWFNDKILQELTLRSKFFMVHMDEDCIQLMN